jgi:hypothetical protein
VGRWAFQKETGQNPAWLKVNGKLGKWQKSSVLLLVVDGMGDR